MKQILLIALAVVVSALPSVGFEGQKPPEKVTIEGTVGNVSLVAGQGLCFLTVKRNEFSEERTSERKVILGSMRYLMDKGFNPRAGDAIKVVGFPLADQSVAAASIELPAKKQSVRFRDDNGRPLWSGGRGPGMGGPGMGGPGMGGGPGGGRGPRNRGGGR